ncbi:uncharacterized protein LOC110103071 isoform X1 [Dendrobium catenatum]|uniref:uncharacterized protein LOC110103071 isoform X1 n=2 Tax=Dendrobium catenatum TaxID=906689 RepID=UPI0009F2FD1C|nr:uncharacterized protein LOC110103071 isoform X1 [Dendrobium catenatum]
MVQLTSFDRLWPEPKQLFTTVAAVPIAVKDEIEDYFDQMQGPLNKRSKLAELDEQLESKMVMPSAHYDPLEEPSPLGLRLKKSPSFLDLIQMRLSQGKPVSTSSFTGSSLETVKNKEFDSAALSNSVDKMKASNFPASILRIGNWEYVSRYEGDLVAKCYFAKHKLVWEVLDGGLKNKIEIQWSDITALKATYQENGSEILDVMLARRPLFFRETNPQPRKHTLWQATSDFTGGQASIHRRHFLQCQQGLLNKHFEKLIQCDPRLKSLSLQPDIILESSCFEPPSCLEDKDESKCLGFDKLKENHESSAEFHDPKPLCAKAGTRNTIDAGLDLAARQMIFHDSGIYRENTSLSNQPVQLEQLKVPELKASMSKDDLVSHLEHCISEQMASGNPVFSADCLLNKETLEEWADYFLTDSQSFDFDENSLLSKVNSLNRLLQKDPSNENLQSASIAGMEDRQDFIEDDSKQLQRKKVFDDPQPCGISRKDSIGDFLMNFPRIGSIPQYLHLFSIEEDNDNQAIF